MVEWEWVAVVVVEQVVCLHGFIFLNQVLVQDLLVSIQHATKVEVAVEVVHHHHHYHHGLLVQFQRKVHVPDLLPQIHIVIQMILQPGQMLIKKPVYNPPSKTQLLNLPRYTKQN